MMKLHVVSDLHLGEQPMDPLWVKGDVLVLAGDIGDKGEWHVLDIAEPYLRRGKPVIYTPGNHEFWECDFPKELLALSRACRRAGIHFLHNSSVVIEDVRFLGAPLWTDFNLAGDPASAMRLAAEATKDFSEIGVPGEPSNFTPETMTRMYRRTVRFLERAFSEPFHGANVVLTHYAPHPGSVHPKFEGSPANPCFVSNLEPQILRWQPDLWVHGHTHTSFDYTVGLTRVLCNPRGYSGLYTRPDGEIFVLKANEEFNPELVVDL